MGKSALNKHSKFKKKSCPRERGVQPPQHPPSGSANAVSRTVQCQRTIYTCMYM